MLHNQSSKDVNPQRLSHTDTLHHTELPTSLGSCSQSLSELWLKNKHQWRTALIIDLSLMPDRSTMRSIFAYYINEIEPTLNLINGIILGSQLDELFDNIESLYGMNTDGLDQDHLADHASAGLCQSFWSNFENYGLISLSFSILYLAYDTIPLAELHSMGLLLDCNVLHDVVRNLEKIYSISEYFLRQSKFEENGTLWVLKSMMIQQRRHYRMNRPLLAATWHSMAVRIARNMGLSRLGDTLEDLERFRDGTHSDNQVPKLFLQGLGAFRQFREGDMAQRELARKIWNAIVIQDWFVSVQIDLNYSISEEMNQTCPPALLDDKEVCSLATLPLETLKDSDRISQNNFLRIKLEIGRTSRLLSEACSKSLAATGSLMPPFETVLMINRMLGDIQASLPSYFHLHCSRQHIFTDQQLHSMYPYLNIQRLFVHETLHHQLLRLHTIYLINGLFNKDYRLSVHACIESAKVIVFVWEELQRLSNPNQHAPQLKWHLLLSGAVLAYIVSAKIAKPFSEALVNLPLEIIQEELEKVVSLLEKIRPGKNLGPYGLSFPITSLQQFCRQENPISSLAMDIRNSNEPLHHGTSPTLTFLPHHNDSTRASTGLPLLSSVEDILQWSIFPTIEQDSALLNFDF